MNSLNMFYLLKYIQRLKISNEKRKQNMRNHNRNEKCGNLCLLKWFFVCVCVWLSQFFGKTEFEHLERKKEKNLKTMIKWNKMEEPSEY